MLKNIDKCGFYKSFDGKIQFSKKVTSSNQNKTSVGAVRTGTEKLKNQINSSKKVESTNIDTSKHKYQTTSAFGFGGNSGTGMGGITAQALGTSTPYMRVLDGIINEDDWITKRKIYSDIYTYDLAGAVVDLISNLPYSEFNLMGIDDPAIIDGYNKAISGLHLDQLMPAITTDYLVNGAFVGSLNWDSVNSRFSALMPHSLDDCEITDIGLFGAEPVIDLTLGDAFGDLLSKRGDPRIDRLFNNLPDYLREGATQGTIQLNPITTLYIPRRGKSDSNIGNSYFNRILTIHLLEKALIKGTIETAQRRQRAIMHIQCLTGDTLISTERGLIRIDSLVNFDTSKESSYPLDIKIKGRFGKFESTKYVHYRGKKNTIRIITSSGRTIACTEDHKFQVLNENNDLIWVEAKDLLDKNICIDNQGMLQKDQNISLNLETYKIGKEYKRQDIKKPEKLNPDLAYILGSLTGDGVYRESGITFSSTCLYALQQISEKCLRIFNAPLNIIKVGDAHGPIYSKIGKWEGWHQNKDLYEGSLHSVQVSNYLHQIGLKYNSEYKDNIHEKVKSWNVSIPDIILQSDSKCQYAFIAGLIDTDGTVNISDNRIEISISSRSEKLKKQLQILFTNMGLKSIITFSGIKLNVYNSEELYRNIHNYLLIPYKKINSLIGMKIKFSKDGISSKALLNFINSRSTFEVPEGTKKINCKIYYRNDADQIINPKIPNNKIMKHIKGDFSPLSYARYKDGYYNDLLEVLKEISEKEFIKYKELLDSNYLFEKVIAIEENGIQDTYDITMEDNIYPAFIANGIVVHNCGIEDSWEPTSEELNDIASYFQAADLDPISGIVVTRNGVNISDVKQGHDFWSWDETFDFAVNAKMRALGVNEAILSGDASFNTLEAALSSFIDNISTIRDKLTREVFTNKLFAITAYENNYKLNKKSNNNQVLSSIVNPLFNRHITTVASPSMSNLDIGDLSQYAIPTVQWVKQLKPKADKDYLDILNQLSEKGIPISLRMFAAAGGENIDDLVASMDDDNDLRLEIADRKKELIDDAVKDKTEKYLGIENIDELLPQSSDNDNEMYAKLEAYTKENQGIINNKKKYRNLAQLDEIYGVREYDNTGKRRILTSTRKKQLENKIHKQIAEAYVSLDEKKKSI